MLKIGGIWGKIAKNSDTRYLSFGFDKAFYKFVPQLKGCSMVAFYIKETDKKNDKAPDYELYIDADEPKTKNKAENIVEFDDIEEEIPF